MQIHLILKNVGLRLRSDDPRALKDMILAVQQRASETGIGEKGRARYLLEMVYDLKNNKSVGGGAEIFGGEKYVKQHAALKNIRASAEDSMSDPLHSSRDQLLDETKQGKWWKHAETKLDKVAHSSTISNDEVDAKVVCNSTM